MTTPDSDYKRMDFEYECGACGLAWDHCTCPAPDAATVAARIAVERKRLLGR